MWDLLGPGIEPMSPALTGGFFTTESMATHSSILAGNSQGQRSLQATVHGVAKSQTQLSS